MTLEEIREKLWYIFDKLDELYRKRCTSEELLHKEREAYALEVRILRTEMRRKLAEKDSTIAEKDIRLAEKDNRIVALELEVSESKAATIDCLENLS